MKKTASIEQIRRRYKRQWLLIAIDKMDERTTTPLKGRLIAHSPYRDEIGQLSIKYPKGSLVVFSEDSFPPGYIAAFLQWLKPHSPL